MFNLRVGNIAGIPIRMNITWLLLAIFGVSLLKPLFVGSGNAQNSFPLITMLLILVSIVLHEAGHAIVAQRRGLKVAHITLMLTGGVTELERDVTTPADEFTIGVAGPLVSLSLAVLSAGAAWVSNGAWQTLWWIVAGTNALLVLLNMIPCQPLDGGRIARAIFWFLHNDLLQATTIVSTMSRWIGNGALLLGVIVAFTADPWTGIMLMLLGWMTTRSAMMHYTHTLMNYMLSRVTVREIMQAHFRTVPPQTTLDSFIGQYILGQHEHGFLVVQAERLVGLMTVRHVYRYAMSQWRQTLVSDAMTPSKDLPTITPDDDAHHAYQLLLRQHFEMLPVTDGDTPLGLIRQRDILEFISRALQKKEK